jgi:uncharacterized protein
VDRVFLDANVLFSAAYRSDTGLRRLWQLPEVILLTSSYAAAEARRNLTTPQQRVDLTSLLASIKIVPEVSEPLSIPLPVELRPKDRPILAAAIHSQATHLLTGDDKDFGQYYGQTIAGVQILRPAVYIRMRKDTGSDPAINTLTRKDDPQ